MRNLIKKDGVKKDNSMINKQNENKVLSLAINEVVSGIHIENLEKKVGLEKDLEILAKKVDGDQEHEWTCEELKLQRNVLCELLKELDSFEFSTRLGYSEDEVWELLKNIKSNIDISCYANPGK